MQITVKGSVEVQAMLKAIGRQAPFAMAKALNDTANDAQAAVKAGLSSRFTLRRKAFVEQTIYRKGTDFATKTRLQAIVKVNPERDFLAQHEDGGQKGPLSGTHVAIPLPGIRRNNNNVVPREMRPSALRLSQKVQKVVTPRGTFLVMNKTGTGKGGTVGWRTDFIYELKNRVPIRPRLQFQVLSRKAIDDNYDRRAILAIEFALRTAR